MQDCIFRGGVRQLLHALLDPERGTATRIVTVNYQLHDAAVMRESPWVAEMAREIATFRDLLASASLPPQIAMQVCSGCLAACGSDQHDYSHVFCCLAL